MDGTSAIALIGATLLLVAIPGPNLALIVANTLARGFRYGAMTVAGTTSGIAVQLAVVVIGLAALLEFATLAFAWLKWAGVAYLLYLGVVSWRQGANDLEPIQASSKPLQSLFWQGLLVATVNPKTLLFNAAFLPQFVSAEAGPASLLATAVLYLSVIFIGDLIWVASAQSARLFLVKLGRLRHRLTGCLLVGSGIGLALARAER